MAPATSGTGREAEVIRSRVPAPWVGVVFLMVVGSVWHFVHAASGDSALVGLVAPVNESVWEHTKLIAFPMLMWAAIVGWRTRRLSAAFVGGVAGGLVGTVLMVVGYYGYVAMLGSGWFPMDMVLFALCALVALAVFEHVRVLRAPAPIAPARVDSPLVASALVAVELAIFAALTVAPPDWPMFVPGVR